VAVAVYEVLARYGEERRHHRGSDMWRNYPNPTILERADQVRQPFSIVSTGVPIHIDAYPQPDSSAPVLVLNHGGATHGRMFTEQIMFFYDRGYMVVVGDRRGHRGCAENSPFPHEGSALAPDFHWWCCPPRRA
jgi:predicted alpha/beta-fold hydrolase